MLKKQERIEVVLIEDVLSRISDPKTISRLNSRKETLLQKLDLEQDSKLIEEFQEKFKTNPSLRGQFSKKIRDLENGNFSSFQRQKKVRRSQRKRGYTDKGSMAPYGEKVRRGIDQEQVICTEVVEQFYPLLIKFIYRYLPYNRFIESAEGLDFIWLPQLEDVLADRNLQRELSEFKFNLLQELELVIQEYPFKLQKDWRKFEEKYL